MTNDNHHDHDDHKPDAREVLPENSHHELMAKALRELLIEKGLITADEVRAMIEQLESPGVHLGARIVAHAWKDPDYRARLLADGKAAIVELGIAATEAQIVVLENTPGVHNMVVCTLCSCYPRSILGQPPAGYVSRSYRARAVKEPREVLAELGMSVPAGIEVRVHDSTAEMQYLVLPMQPSGTDGLSEEQLASLITRDSLIGTALPAGARLAAGSI
jgi:nitrile hydratase